MHKSEFDAKLIEEIEKSDAATEIKKAAKKLVLFQISSHGRMDFDDYDKIFEEVLNNK